MLAVAATPVNHPRSETLPRRAVQDSAEHPDEGDAMDTSVASRAERIDAGRALRRAVPRSAHAEWVPPPDRADPVDVLVDSGRDRVPELLPIRYGRMSHSPFTFYRGSAAVMASDLSGTPTTGVQVQACGDAHLMNFGLFATPERNLVFDLNDFDETAPGPWEWDVKRLAASVAIATRDNGLPDAAARTAAQRSVESYRRHLWDYADRSPLEVWYDRLDTSLLDDARRDDAMRARARKLVAKAQRRVGEHLVPKLTELVGGRPRIVDQPPLLFHVEELGGPETEAGDFLDRYRESLPEERRILLDRYRIVDAAVKVVGVGSVGTRAFVALLMSPDDQPLLLQVKEAQASVLDPYNGQEAADHNGRRVVVGQRMMQAASDIFLGWSTGPRGREFYVRQLRDMKLSVDLTGADEQRVCAYAEICGWALARAHARTGDAATIAGYLGRKDRFDRALGEFAIRYADQAEQDHGVLLDAVREGRIEARSDV